MRLRNQGKTTRAQQGRRGLTPPPAHGLVRLLLVWILIFVTGFQTRGVAAESGLDIWCPQEYRSASIAEIGDGLVFQEPARSLHVRPVTDFMAAETLHEDNPLDVGVYLAKRIPKPMRTLLASPTTRLILLPDLLPQALSMLQKHGLSSGTIFLARLDARVQVAYLLYQQPKGITVVVTHLFGRTRLEHLVHQYAHYFHRIGRPLDQIEIWETVPPDDLSRALCVDSLRALQNDTPTVICSGYFGSLKHLLADYEVFRRHHPGTMPTLSALDQIREREQPGQIDPAPGGNPFYPWWQTMIQHPDGSQTRIIGFRNLYGDQTGTLFSCLLEKGFRRFVLFSNGGGLAHTELRRLYAPAVARAGNAVLPLKNRAGLRYPARSLVSVPSLLVETWRWLKRHQFCSLVDVEGFHAAHSLTAFSDARLYYAILVSDRPGHIDITRKEEDAPESIAAKRDFFFHVLRDLLRNDF